MLQLNTISEEERKSGFDADSSAQESFMLENLDAYPAEVPFKVEQTLEQPQTTLEEVSNLLTDQPETTQTPENESVEFDDDFINMLKNDLEQGKKKRDEPDKLTNKVELLANQLATAPVASPVVETEIEELEDIPLVQEEEVKEQPLFDSLSINEDLEPVSEEPLADTTAPADNSGVLDIPELNNVLDEEEKKKKRRAVPFWFWIAAGLLFTVAVGGGGLYWWKNSTTHPGSDTTHPAVAHNVQPKENHPSEKPHGTTEGHDTAHSESTHEANHSETPTTNEHTSTAEHQPEHTEHASTEHSNTQPEKHTETKVPSHEPKAVAHHDEPKSTKHEPEHHDKPVTKEPQHKTEPQHKPVAEKPQTTKPSVEKEPRSTTHSPTTEQPKTKETKEPKEEKKPTVADNNQVKVIPKPVPKDAPSNKGVFYVQVYATPSQEDANDWVNRLKQKSISNAFITKQNIRNLAYYRVRFGSFPTRQEAEAAALKLGYASAWIDRVK